MEASLIIFAILGDIFGREEIQLRWPGWIQRLLERSAQRASLLFQKKLWWWECYGVGGVQSLRQARNCLHLVQDEKC